MALGAYEGEAARGNVLNALAHPTVVNPMAAIGGAVQTARGIADLRTTQFNLQQAQLQPAYQSMRMLMATNPNPSWDDVNAALSQSARIGGNIGGLVANAAEIAANGGKPADFMRATAMGGMSPESQGTLAGPQFQSRQTAQGTYYGNVGGPWSPNANVFQPTGFLEKGVSPEWAGTRVPVVGPGGVTQMVPQGALMGSGGGYAGGAGTGAGAAVNNFGNIRAPGGGFASFNTPQDGIAAMTGLLGSYQDQHGINTLNGITARWAPAGDGANNPAAYAATVSKLTGIDPNAKLDLHDPATLAKIIPAMAQVEHGRPMGVGPDVLTAGISTGLSGGTAAGGPSGAATAQPGAPQPSGPFIGATSAQPVTGPSANVRPAGSGGMQYFPASPGGSGGGTQIPGVGAQTPYGPVLAPPAPWMGPIWEQSAKQYSGDLDKEGTLPARMQPWESAMSILNANPDLKTGPTSQQWNAWASTLQQYGIQLPSMPTDSVTAYQELGKNLARGLAVSGAATSPTDLARLQTEASMPSTQMTPETIRQLVARQIGYERAQTMRLMYFRSLHPGEDADQYAGQYRSQTNPWFSKLDLVALGADHMSDQDIATYLKGLPPADQAKFKSTITEASKLMPDFARAGQ